VIMSRLSTMKKCMKVLLVTGILAYGSKPFVWAGKKGCCSWRSKENPIGEFCATSARVSRKIAENIVKEAKSSKLLNPADTLRTLEIGAGDGAMTVELFRLLEREKAARTVGSVTGEVIEGNPSDFTKLIKNFTKNYQEFATEEEVTIDYSDPKCVLINGIAFHEAWFNSKWQSKNNVAQYDIVLYSLPNTILTENDLKDILPEVHKLLKPGGLFIYVFNWGARGWFEKWLTLKVRWVKTCAFLGGWIPTKLIPARLSQWAKSLDTRIPKERKEYYDKMQYFDTFIQNNFTPVFADTFFNPPAPQPMRIFIVKKK